MTRPLALLAIVALHAALVAAPQRSPQPTAAGLISGRVIDGVTSQPIPGALVTLTGHSGPTQVATDDAGRFAFPELEAGGFDVRVEKDGYLRGGWLRTVDDWNAQIVVEPGQRVENITLRAWRKATISGTLRNQSGTPMAGVAIGLLTSRADWSRPSGPLGLTEGADTFKTDAAGRYSISDLRPGRYIAVAIPTIAGPLPAGPGRLYATTFYPGVTALTGAQAITLAAGETRDGVDITLIAQRAFGVSGTVRGRRQPIGTTSISLSPVGAGFLSADPGVESDPSGRFTLPLVRPDTYDLVAVQPSVDTAEHMEYRGRGRVVVVDRDQTNIEVTLLPDASISGRIDFPGVTNSPALDRLPFMLRPERPTMPDLRAGDDGDAEANEEKENTPIGPDGRFTLRNVAPGRYVFYDPQNDEAWKIASIKVGGRDVTATSITVGQSNISDVVVTMTRRTPIKTALVSGFVRMADGSKAGDGWILFYTADLKQREVYRFAPDGRYGFFMDDHGGDYLLSAVPLDPGVPLSDALLATLAKTAVHVTVAEGAKVTVDVPMWTRQTPESSDFLLHINQAIDPALLNVTSMLRGAFGGYSQYGDRLPGLKMTGPRDVAIATVHGGQAATSLRVVVYCRGYEFAFVDVPDLGDPASRQRAIDLVPLGWVPLAGRVILPAREDASQFIVEIGYDASPIVFDYFMRGVGNSAGSFLSSTTPVATATVKADGSFTAMVPDFFRDAFVAQAPSKGTFRFSARSPLRAYPLVAEDATGPMSGGQPITVSYDGGIVLRVIGRAANER